MKNLLDPKKDPIGKALLDYLNGERQHFINVRTSIALDEELDPAYFFREYETMPELEQIALQHCKGKVLDVGAGAGSHALYLQSKNVQVDAIDVSPQSVEVMKKRGIKNSSLINFYSLKESKYDTLLFLMNGFGMAEKLKNVSSFLNHCMSLLNDGGQLLFDSSDIHYLYEQEDGSFMIDLNAEYYGEISYQINYRDIIGSSFNWLFLDPNKLKSICNKQNINLEILTEDSHYQYLAKISK